MKQVDGTAKLFDIFISHNSRDKPLIDPVVQRLHDEYDIRAWVDQWDLHAAEEWEPAILRGLRSCRLGAIVLGANGWGNYHLREARLALELRQTRPDFRVIPVLLPGANAADVSVMADFFTRTHRVDFTNGVADEEAFRRLVAAIRGEAPGPPPLTVFAINRAARQWHQAAVEDKPSILFRGGELRQAQQITATHGAMLTDDAVQFLSASAEDEQRKALAERKRTRKTIAALVIGIIVLVLATIYAFVQREAEQKARLEEQKARLDATRQRDLAHTRELIARADSELNVDPASSLSFALDAVKVADTAEAVLMLRRAIVASKVRIVMRGHRGAVNDLAVNRDGSRVATAGSDGTARVWDPRTGRELWVLALRAERVEAIAFSPTGDRIATADSSGMVRFWDAKTGRPVGTPLRLGSAGVGGDMNLSFTPDGRTLLFAASAHVYSIDAGSGRITLDFRVPGSFIRTSFSADGSLVLTKGEGALPTLWDARTGGRRAELGGYMTFESQTFGVFSHDGKLAITAGSGDMQVWDTATGKRRFTLQPPGAWGVFDAAFTRNGRAVITGGNDDTVRMWDLWGGRSWRMFPHPTSVTAIRVSLDDRFVMTIGADAVIRVWHCVNGGLVAELRGHTEEITAAEFLPDGVSVITASVDGTTRIWDALGDQQAVTLSGHAGSTKLSRAVYSPDGRAILTAGEDGTARLSDAATGRVTAILSGHDGAVVDACFIPRRGWIATAGADATARLWDARTGRLHAVLRGHDRALTSVAADTAGDRIVTAGDDHTARIWSVPARRQLIVLRGHGAGVNQARFTLDGTQIVTASDDGTSRIWTAADGKTTHVLRGRRQILATFSPDGRQVLTMFGDEGPLLWDARTGRQIGSPPEATTDLDRPSFSPDGKSIVAMHRNGSIGLWSTPNLRLIRRFADSAISIEDAAFSDDARFIAMSSQAGLTRVWDVATGRVLSSFFGDSHVYSVSFSPDASRILVHELDAVRIYTCEACGTIDDLRRLASRRVAAVAPAASR